VSIFLGQQSGKAGPVIYLHPLGGAACTPSLQITPPGHALQTHPLAGSAFHLYTQAAYKNLLPTATRCPATVVETWMCQVIFEFEYSKVCAHCTALPELENMLFCLGDLLTYLKCTEMHHLVINLIKTTAHQTQDFQLEKHQKTFGGRAPPGPAGGA